MAEKQYVTYGQSCGCGCGGGETEESKKVTGCRFSLSLMSDRYIDFILGALAKVDTSRVWKMTDKLSTVYRGRQIYVEDAVKACFVHAFHEGVHMTMEATFSRGCPGDTEADCLMAAEDAPRNAPDMAEIHFPVACKISLYPMGVMDYMRHIAEIVNHAIDLGLYERSSHYCTILSGDVHDLFDYFHYVNSYCSENLSHYVFEVTLSVNSPTAE